jgi:hypothetical protein
MLLVSITFCNLQGDFSIKEKLFQRFSGKVKKQEKIEGTA